MTMTPASSPNAYCPVTEFLKRVDQRTVQQLVSDSGTDAAISLLPVNANVLAALLTASGMFESAVLCGKRYKLDDLQALAGMPIGVGLSNLTGGTIAAGTYGYRVTTTTAAGETLPSAEVTATTGSTGSILISWLPVSGTITGYNVYGRTPLAELKIAATTVTTYTDTGSVSPSGALPTQSTAGVLNAGQALMVQIVADVAYWYLAQRRPERRAKMPESYETSMKLMEALSMGERIFGFMETADAGLMHHQVETSADVLSRNMISWQANRLLGTRANMYPHRR